MTELARLIDEVNAARSRFIATVDALSPRASHFKPSADVWSVVENTEHIVRAEQGGINGMWKAVEGAETGRPAWTGDAIHRGKSIEQIVEETWREKEQVPETAAPVWGGPLSFWISLLRANQFVLEELGRLLARYPLDRLYYPHPISGPLDMRQRHEFLRFHLDRHRNQVVRLQQHPDFSQSDR